MGGMLSVTVRENEFEIYSFKVRTSFLNKTLNDPKILNLTYLKKILLENALLHEAFKPEEGHDDYESHKAVKSPYMYGMVLVDYVNNKLLSANNYCALLKGSTAKLLDEYKDLVKQNFILKVYGFHEGQEQLLHTHNLLHTSYREWHEVYFLNQALLNGGSIVVKGQPIKADSLEDAVGQIYAIDLKGKSPAEQHHACEKHIKRKQSKREELAFRFQDYEDIDYGYAFEVFNGASALDCHVILEYMKANGFQLTEYEEDYWKKFLKEEKQKAS